MFREMVESKDIKRMVLVEKLEQLEKENKKLKEKLSEITMVADDEKQSIEHILELEEENKKLKEDVDFYYKSAKQFREQVEKWEKDFVEGRIVEKD